MITKPFAVAAPRIHPIPSGASLKERNEKRFDVAELRDASLGILRRDAWRSKRAQLCLELVNLLPQTISQGPVQCSRRLLHAGGNHASHPAAKARGLRPRDQQLRDAVQQMQLKRRLLPHHALQRPSVYLEQSQVRHSGLQQHPCDPAAQAAAVGAAGKIDGASLPNPVVLRSDHLQLQHHQIQRQSPTCAR
eukprot:scaffold347_cov239-Pinguiococcus_pyrenoidosus.AAC.21